MKYAVSDDAVRKYADRILSGGPLGTLFPGKMSECDFTETQRELIRKARADKKAKLRAVNTPNEIKKIESPRAEVTVAGIESDKIKPLTKLRKMLYLQSGRCFFCGEILNEEEASIEHLHPISRGGMRYAFFVVTGGLALANKADPANPAIAPQLHSNRHWRRVTDPERWPQ